MPVRHAAIALLLAVSLAAQEPPRIGTPVAPPDDARRVEQTYGLLAERPTARITAPYELTVELRTREPTPPGVLYLGLNTLDEDLDWPRYRTSARESGDEPRTEHRFVARFDRLLRMLPNTAFEPRVVWRAELWIPSKRSARFVEGRAYFDPESGGDTVNVTFGPVVDQVTKESAVVSWETDRPADAEVRIAGRTVRRDEPAVRHSIRIDGLLAGTSYTYHVASGGTTVRPYSLRTADDGPFSFATMVDSREGVGGGLRNLGGVEGYALRVLSGHAYRQGVSFVLFAGDLVNGYTTSVVDFEMQLESWRRAVEPVHARIPIYEGMGNHESLVDAWRDGSRTVYADKRGADSAEAAFARAFVNPTNGPRDEGDGSPSYDENVYWYDWGNARFFVLNNNYWWCDDPHRHGGNLEGFVLPAQLEWLREQVARADADPKVEHLFFAAQEPPFPNGGHTGDAMWYRGGDTNRDRKVDGADVPIVQNRNAMWQIISGSPKTVAFITGDEHAYSRLLVAPDTPVGPRTLPDGGPATFEHPVWQITSGGAGAPWYDKELDLPWSGELRAHSTQPHYALFRIDGGDVELEAISQTGQRVDAARLRVDGRNLTR